MTGKQAEKQDEATRSIAARVPVAMVEAIEQWARKERKRTGDNVSQSKAIAMLLGAALGIDETGAPLAKAPAAKPPKPGATLPALAERFAPTKKAARK